MPGGGQGRQEHADRGRVAHRGAVQRHDLAARHRIRGTQGHQVVAERRPAEPGDQRYAEPRADQGQVALELHRDVRDLGQAAGAVVHSQQPLPADRPLGRGNPVLGGEVAGRDHRAARQGVVAAHDHLGEVVAERGAGQVAGHRQRDVAPAVRDAKVGLPGRDQVDGVPWLVFGQGDAELRVGGEHGRQGGRDQAPHRGGERSQPHAPGDRSRLLVKAGPQLLQVRQQAAALLGQVPAVPGQHYAASDPLEQRNPRLPFQALDLL